MQRITDLEEAREKNLGRVHPSLRLFSIGSPSSSSHRLATAAEVCKERGEQMGDKPDIIDANILRDVNEYQNARHKDAEKDITPLGNRICRASGWEQKQANEQNQSWEKQRKDQEINIHRFDLSVDPIIHSCLT